ncbi:MULTISPECIES: ABC transporter permease [unclassified Streptomyces]|uniref:ABC transporter permease n=1 Tax=unclassified Streptomyces TaxID=2593676 RepID=UPI000DAD5442|nr:MULTISPECIES: ABC transporter permease [unclassified Streptomyces]PZT75940.1 ABC transporter permease [Streptomyces sp. AC1-42W]PZT80109.1 ABC transporter permease [Streptomyces sp. AC1-42T]
MSAHFAQDIRHLKVLFLTEWKLFNRLKANYVYAVFVPVMLLVALQYAQEQMGLAQDALAPGPVMVSTSTGVLLIFSLYSFITSLYVVRRDELVLKGLRTGEVSDPVILAGGASVYIVICAAQIVVVAAGVSVIFGIAPAHPLTAAIGVLVGITLMTAMAAATAALCRSAESVTIATLPAILLLPLISGVYIPREILPVALGDILLFAPLSPTVDLVRAGWTDGMAPGTALGRVLLGFAWTALFAWVAARKFRWEPRT